MCYAICFINTFGVLALGRLNNVTVYYLNVKYALAK